MEGGWAGRMPRGAQGCGVPPRLPAPPSPGPAHTPGRVAAAASVCVARGSEPGDPGGKEEESPEPAAQLLSLPQLSGEVLSDGDHSTLGRPLCLGWVDAGYCRWGG